MAKIDVKSFLEKRYEKLIENVEEFEKQTKITPHLATILVGSRKDSEIYVSRKEECIKKAHMTSETIKIEDGTPVTQIASIILELNSRHDVTGILLQLPLNREFYSKEDEDTLIGLIDVRKDVDGLNPVNQAHLFMGKDQSSFLTPCTPTGIVMLLKKEVYNNSLKGLDVTVIGRSQLLGNSLAQMLMRENANVTILHSKSGWIMSDYLAMNSTDVLCLCAGQSNLIHASDLDIEQDYTIIDAAINIGEDGKLRGDLCKEDYEALDDWAFDGGYTVDYTSVPGGVGPITTFTLAYNLYKAACLANTVVPKDI